MPTYDMSRGQLGHVNHHTLHDATKNDEGLPYPKIKDEPCQHCMEGKQTRANAPKGECLTRAIAFTIFIRVQYFMTFIDDLLHKTQVCFLKAKTQACETFKVFKASVENETGKK